MLQVTFSQSPIGLERTRVGLQLPGTDPAADTFRMCIHEHSVCNAATLPSDGIKARTRKGVDSPELLHVDVAVGVGASSDEG